MVYITVYIENTNLTQNEHSILTVKEQQTAWLMPPDRQAEQRAKVTESVLTFLSLETYTSTDILQTLLGYKTRHGTTKALRRLCQAGLIKEHDLTMLTGHALKLWGITVQGIYAINDPEKMPDRVRGFEPSRISLLTLPHKIKCHETAVHALNNRCVIVRSMDLFLGLNKIPDLIIQNPKSGKHSAIEIELTVKTAKRYAKIFREYKQALKSNIVARVYWLTESEKMQQHLQRVFGNVESISQADKEPHQVLTIAEFHQILNRMN